MRAALLAVLVFTAAPARAEVISVELVHRSDLSGGSFGSAGVYQKLYGQIVFAIDPGHPANRTIADIDLAPRNAAGKVELRADFYLIAPRDPARGNGVVLFEAANRGTKNIIELFNRFGGGADPRSARDLGDGFLMEQGFTLLWVGWQFDVPRRAGLMAAYPPVARNPDGTPITGIVRSDFIPRAGEFVMPLADLDHVAYPIADAAHAANVLTVRDTPDGIRRVVPRRDWRVLPGGTSIRMPAGFEPLRIYELVYGSQDPPVAGLGFAAVRDTVALLKGPRAGELGMAAGAIRHAIAFGASQSGRFLRTFIYDGFNEDERGEQVFDGMLVHTAGAGRGSFNMRFAQPSRHGQPYESFFYPTDVFPFADLAQTDPVSGVTDGLMSRAARPALLPKVFYWNTSYEYWGRAASLIHTAVAGDADAPVPPNTRIYLFAGGQHVGAPFPPQRTFGQQPASPLDYRWAMRALLMAMRGWIAEDAAPPPSVYPRIDAGTLVPRDALAFPDVPGLRPPARPQQALRADYGPRFRALGIVTQEPPVLGAPYPVLVPQVDADGNDLGGIRMPELEVPLGTYTGWNLFDPAWGPPDLMTTTLGSFVAFARTRAARERTGDPRPSLEERYPTRARYLALVSSAADALVDAGFLLRDDVDRLVEDARRRFDVLSSAP